jgi:hypothetical protein
MKNQLVLHHTENYASDQHVFIGKYETSISRKLTLLQDPGITHVKIKRRLTECFLKLTPKLVLNDALTEFHEENFMRLRYFQEFVKRR